MNTMLKILLMALAVIATACSTAVQRHSRYADTPDAQTTNVCKTDEKGNEDCVERIDTQVKYDQCVIDHDGDIGFCDLKFDRRGTHGSAQPFMERGNGFPTGPQPIVVVAAPPGPNLYALGGGPVHAGYAYANAASAHAGVSRAEYERDKRQTQKDLALLYQEQLGTPEAPTPPAPKATKKEKAK